MEHGSVERHPRPPLVRGVGREPLACGATDAECRLGCLDYRRISVVEATRRVEQRHAGIVLELAPQRQRELGERDVLRIWIGETEDA